MKISNLLIFILQVIITYCVLVPIFMLFAISDSEFDFIALISLALIQPIFAVIVVTLTIIFIIIIGLPLRFYNPLMEWWKRQLLLPIFGILIGFIILISSFLFKEIAQTEIEGEVREKLIPNFTLVVIGWFVIAFFLIHLNPPKPYLRFLGIKS